jgi:hypothetical protein
MSRQGSGAGKNGGGKGFPTLRVSARRVEQGGIITMPRDYWIELATFENTLFALEPTRRTVPTTITRITANITAYSAMS